jgi:formylglycine-generating enzyme required for sulfatase activity
MRMGRTGVFLVFKKLYHTFKPMAYDIFINYRRDDTLAMAVVLEKFLHNAFSDLRVFLDQAGIQAEQWPDKLRQALEESSLVITLVGPKYLLIHNEHGERRIDETNDWVRQEIETAVDREKILVPLLVDGAEMLSKKAFNRWPKLQKWLDWQAEVISWKTFNADFENLVTLIENKLGKKRKNAASNDLPVNPLDAYPLPKINPLEPDEEDLAHPESERTKATPFLGLRYFRRKDAPLFFGRTVETLQFFELVSNPDVRIIRLYGNTGVGKSSFLAAGVLPRLEMQNRQPFYVRRNKVTGLHRQLAHLSQQESAGTEPPPVYILDQAEEMFTDPVKGEQDQLAAQLSQVLEKDDRATVVLGFRSDYLLEMRELLRRVLVRQEDLPLLPLTQEALTEAVEGVSNDPVLRSAFDLELEPGFSGYVARDLFRTETGSATSILQNRLLKLYEEAYKNRTPEHPAVRLRIADYQALIKTRTAEEELLDYQLQRLRSESGPALPDDKALLEALHTFVLDKPTAGTVPLTELSNERAPLHQALRRVNLLSELRKPDKALRLSHDLLAPVVRRRYDASVKAENMGLKQENLDLLLRQIRTDLPELKFEQAAADLQQSMALGIHPELRAPIAFELAYVFLQAEKSDEGNKLASMYGQLEREADKILPPLPPDNRLDWLRHCDPAHYARLKARYFPETRAIPGGRYEMGDVMGDKEQDDETVHNQELSSFEMGITPVTWQQFGLYCFAQAIDLPHDEGWGRADRPVINVSWYDAIEYANWLNTQYGFSPVYEINKAEKDPNNQSEFDDLKWTVRRRPEAPGFRLATEAEWEYAAREGGRKIRFGNGKDVADPAEINFDASQDYQKPYSVVGLYRKQTTPVRQFSPNALGLYDMSGNVYEWCQDWFGDYPSTPPKDYFGPPKGSDRVVRGGGWLYGAQDCRVSGRSGYNPDSRYYDIGFRLVFVP